MVSVKDCIFFIVVCFTWDVIRGSYAFRLKHESNDDDDDDRHHRHRPHPHHFHDNDSKTAVYAILTVFFVLLLLLLIYYCLRKRMDNRHHSSCPARRINRATHMRYIRLPISGENCEYCNHRIQYQNPSTYGSIPVPNPIVTAPPDYNYLFPQKPMAEQPPVHQTPK